MTLALTLAADAAAAAAAEHALGLVAFGAGHAPGALPCVRAEAALLDPGHHWCALWTTGTVARAGGHAGVRYRLAGELLFGAVAVDEADFGAEADGTPLQHAVEHGYRAIFAVLEAEGCGNLLRVWNYLPRINAIEHGSERYRQFNTGRQHAFAACGRALSGNVPAACALGVAAGVVEIGFLACRRTPQAVENPRQVSAYDYPADYGRHSPTFARAALLDHAGQWLLFVSGTASIVGHRTLHVGDAVAQTREALANIDAVLAEAGRLAGRVFDARGLACVAYVRHARDLPAVRAEIRARLGEAAAVAYVQADICRDDLLVEIEASGGHPIRGFDA